jgi:hypothetical protein
VGGVRPTLNTEVRDRADTQHGICSMSRFVDMPI